MDHILYGSDWPFSPEPENGLSEDELAALARGNAEQLFPRLAQQN
jgi:predicted TIM-barrel fold metal-dependent hydrolase